MSSGIRIVPAILAAFSLFSTGLFANDKRNDPDQIGNRNVGRGLNFYSVEKEIQLGKELAEEVGHQSRVINDPVVTEYVNRIGQNIVRNSDANVAFTIKVLDSEEVNACALPGGFLFINSGLILKADSEAELAGVMAHEIAHVAARHATRQASRSELVRIAMVTASIALPYTMVGYGAIQAANFLIPVGFLRLSRSMEREADFLGLQYAYKTGYDPIALVDFFEKIQSMEKKKPGTLAKVFASHPMTHNRIRAAQNEIQKTLGARREYVVNTSEFLDVKARLASFHPYQRLHDDPDRPTLHRWNLNESGILRSRVPPAR